MKRLTCGALFLLAAVTAGVIGEDDINSATANSPKYNTNISPSTTSTGECVEHIVVKGKGIDDKLEGACAENYVSFIATEKILVVGDPEKDSIALFSDLPSNLMVIKKGECERIKYTSTGKTKTVLSVKDCNRIKKKMSDELKNNGNVKRVSVKSPKLESAGKPVVSGKTSGTVKFSDPNPWISDTDGLNYDGVNNDSPSVKTNPVKFGEECILSITVIGSGIADRFKGPCMAKEDPKVYISGKTLIIGDINKDRLTLFSDQRSTLYVIRDGETCTKQVYVTFLSRTAGTSMPISETSCQKIKNQIKNEVENAKANPQQWVSNDPEILSKKYGGYSSSGAAAAAAAAAAPPVSQSIPEKFTPPAGLTFGSRAYRIAYADWLRKQALQAAKFPTLR